MSFVPTAQLRWLSCERGSTEHARHNPNSTMMLLYGRRGGGDGLSIILQQLWVNTDPEASAAEDWRDIPTVIST